jgi:hypothetical protein
MGGPQRKQHGYRKGQSADDAMKSVLSYLRGSGFDGSRYPDRRSAMHAAYRTIIGGSPNASLKARDINASIGEHLQRLEAHRNNARRFLAGG